MEYKFNDKMGHRSRPCQYGILHEGKLYSQKETETAKLAIFQEVDYCKDGKWSNSTWKVTTKSARLVVVMSPFSGFGDILDDCLQHVTDSNRDYTGEELTREDALVVFRRFFPKTSARVLALETACNDLV